MISKLNKVQRLAFAVAIAAIATSCSTQKANWTNVQFHNTTAHYNVWWNGNESLKQGLNMLQAQVKDDYTRILPVAKLGTKDESMAMNPQFDRAVEKSVKCIKKHSIFIDGYEHVPYISKCYLMTAYATFYKHDFGTSASTCQMLATQYNGTDIGDEAAVLLARCATFDQRYQDAESSLDELVSNLGKGNFSPKQRLNLYMAMAECTLPQEKYKKGVQFLKMALECHPTQAQKARINYILGQVYLDQDKRPTASKYFERVLKCNPDYEMEFNARLNIASCADLQHTDQAKLERLLNRMLNDKKNEEFQDQIYYAKGEMYMGLRDVKKACENFRTSTAVSKNNPAQKARSAIRLAGIMYDKYQDYDQAQIYYDTAMAIIKSDYPRYSSIKSRYDLLTSLVSFTRVIHNNDSLIAVANMPEKERLEVINKKIEELKKAEEEAKERELLQQYANDSKAQANTLKGDWYFYNESTVQKGKESFRQKWGMRPLEDYWFMSKKGLLGMNMLVQADESANDQDDNVDDEKNDTLSKADKAVDPNGNPNDPHSVAYYLKSLPDSTMQDSMQFQTAVSLLNAGYIYYDGVKNIAKALECYLRLVNQYTDNPEIVQAFYMLYKIYDKQGNTPSSNYYKDMVLMGFPDSDFANMILDEDYYKEILRRDQLINEDYDEIYTLYRKRRYEDVVEAVGLAENRYEGNSLLGRFLFWEGLAYARMDNKSAAINTFQSIISNYSTSDTLVALAQNQLAFLQGDGGKYIANSGGDLLASTDSVAAATTVRKNNLSSSADNVAASSAELSPEAQMFRYKANSPHWVVIIVKEKKIRATQLQGKVGNFIMNYYANSGLKASPLMFTDSTQMVTISSFGNAQEAYDFARHLRREEGPMTDYNADDYQIFAISKQNYTTLYNRKQVDAYNMFYNKYYVK
ncbi:MAG: tetratricopeptide repeat protein [Bacteroidales bacterium]|nr:tetratricopeptide repeat protein [Bacteroidales bacterium]